MAAAPKENFKSSPKKKRVAPRVPDGSVHQEVKRAKLEQSRTRKIIALKNLERLQKRNPEAFKPILVVPEDEPDQRAATRTKQPHQESALVTLSPRSRRGVPHDAAAGTVQPADASRPSRGGKAAALSQGLAEGDHTRSQAKSASQEASVPSKGTESRVKRTKASAERDNTQQPPLRGVAAAEKHVRVGKLQGVRRKPTSRLERTKKVADAELREREARQEERRKAFEEKQKQRLEAQKARGRAKEQMYKRNRKGQPLMKYRVENILQKLQTKT